MRKIVRGILVLSALFGCFETIGAVPELKGDGWFELPFQATATDLQGEYIYLVGGYNSIDAGAPAWGSIVESENLYVGDKAGEVVITYCDGKTETVPLVFGYTMWFRAHWLDGGAPFKTKEAEPEMTACLKKTLHLQGGFEGMEKPVLKVKVQRKPIQKIEIVDNQYKRGEPVFAGGYLVGPRVKKELNGGVAVNAGDPFFDTHTVDSRRAAEPKADLEKMVRRLYTFEDDFKNVAPFTYPQDYNRAKIVFTGNTYANIMTRVYYENMEDMLTKMREDGMIDESSPGAPSWRYDGFGTWVPEANSYYGSMYSRDRALGIFSYLNLLEKSLKTVDFLHQWLMYYPNEKLTLLGKPIPGHWSVIPNKPFVYSKVLTGAGWPTRYTKEVFGEDYQNFGNAEPDGHGLTMMSIANVWRNAGSNAQWVLDNWTYIKEAVHYIDWALKNPDVSFSEHGLIYGETEGGMMEFTMFNNMPCYLGVKMYAEMARKAGKTKEADEWALLADDMGKAILAHFASEGKWKMEKFGFFHDPSLSIYADYVGYDVVNDVPQVVYDLCRNTYQEDVDRYIGDTYMGVRGLGYDHNIISQTALLLDKCDDYDKFITNLSKLCYSPRLPKPFIVPEGASYCHEKGMFRRQGDLGNFVQQNETVRTALMVAGTSKVRDNVIKIMPRLPQGWSVDVSDLTINGSDAKISYRVNYPKKEVQEAVFKVTGKGNLDTLKFRAGPFQRETVSVNGKTVRTERTGDANWAWITIDNLQDGQQYTFTIN